MPTLFAPQPANLETPTADHKHLPVMGQDARLCLIDFADEFRDVFARADQARWLTVYLRGLLEPGGRKCVEALARRLFERPAAAAQALQNFLHQSPWDEARLLTRLWQILGPRWADLGGPGVVVLHEVTFPKRGTHSVGVQRQRAADQGRKLNCQAAVAVGALGPDGYLPLALRLYLPRAWAGDAARLDAAGVPAESRGPAGKAQLALRLAEQVRAAGWPAEGAAVLGPLAESAELRDGLAAARFAPATADEFDAGRVADGVTRLRDGLGLDHFEGRSWRGWHHHTALVLAAHGFEWLLRGEE